MSDDKYVYFYHKLTIFFQQYLETINFIYYYITHLTRTLLKTYGFLLVSNSDKIVGTYQL